VRRLIHLKSNDPIIQKTEIEGLHFETNLYTTSTDNGIYNVIASSGPGITDLVTHSPISTTFIMVYMLDK
jgi:hypothetical protein